MTSGRGGSTAGPQPENSTPWAAFAAVVAGLVLLGGLGSGFASSLHEPPGSDWEDE